MGNKKSANNEKTSPWDILQIDDQTKRDTKLWNADDIFFKNNKKSVASNERPNLELNEAVVESAKSDDKLKEEFNFVGTDAKQTELPTLDVVADNDNKKYAQLIFKIIRHNFYKLIKKLQNYKMAIQTKKTWLMIIFLMVCILFFSWLISPQTMVQTVKITGNDTLKSQQIISATGIKVKRSIFGVWLHEKQLEQQALKANNQLKSIKISVINPTSVNVAVKEATKVGYVLRNGKYYLVLDGGQVLSQGVSTTNLGLPTYDGFKQDDNFRKMIAYFATLSAPIKSSISEIKFKPNKNDRQKIIIFMNDGNQVNARITTFADKMAYYPSIAAQMDKPGVINLEVGAFSISYEQIKQNKKIEADKKAKIEAEKKAKAEHDKAEAKSASSEKDK